MIVLPSFSALLKKSPQMESPWRTTIQETRNLYRLLSLDPKGTGNSSAPGPEVKAVESLSSSLKEHLGELRTFAADLRLQLIQQSKVPEADGSVCVGIDTLLETPFPSSLERVELWKAGRDLARRLLEESLATAWQPKQVESAETEEEGGEEIGTESVMDDARRTARWSIDLLQLGGLEAREPEIALEKASEPDAVLSYPFDVARLLYTAWAKELPRTLEAKLKDDSDLIGADRLSRIVPPLDQARQVGRSHHKPDSPLADVGSHSSGHGWRANMLMRAGIWGRPRCSPRPPRAVEIWQTRRRGRSSSSPAGSGQQKSATSIRPSWSSITASSPLCR